MSLAEIKSEPEETVFVDVKTTNEIRLNTEENDKDENLLVECDLPISSSKFYFA